ncbi:MAG: hypothetical protein ACRDY4_00575, partial [Acidimicrobiia bacterium]
DVPEAYRDAVSPRSDAFLACLLLPAMNYHEHIDVRGPISPRLALGVEDYQRVFHSWFPRRFHTIDIRADDDVAAEMGPTTGAVGAAFSGGIDSFYTLWSHRPGRDQRPHAAMSHALLVQGFDIPLDDTDAFEALRASYRDILARMGVKLLTVRTNAASFAPRGNWGVFHGAPLIGVALLLQGLLSHFYLPATHTYGGLVPWGSDPSIDHLLSTETLAVVHDGAMASRVAKTAVVGAWPETFGRLRVCPEATGLVNCCRCPKCIRTMVTLDMQGVLALHPTFPLPLERRAVRRCPYTTESELTFARSIVGQARAARRRDIVADVAIAVAVSRARRALRRARVLLGRFRRRVTGRRRVARR